MPCTTQDDRDECQRLADLLAAASGLAVSVADAEAFFPDPEPGEPSCPDFAAMSARGLYPAAWPLPLERGAVEAAQAAQHAAQHPPGGFGAAHVGLEVQHFWAGDNRWCEGGARQGLASETVEVPPRSPPSPC